MNGTYAIAKTELGFFRLCQDGEIHVALKVTAKPPAQRPDGIKDVDSIAHII